MNDISLPKLSVLDSEMAYREAGGRDKPVALFLHGNPTSSYIWRNIIPLVAEVAHCVAPDLIGFGQSGKPDIAYRFEDHARYLDAFIAKAGIGSAYLVAQDWGTALAFDLAARRPDFVRGLAFMEFIRSIPTWEQFLRGSKTIRKRSGGRSPPSSPRPRIGARIWARNLVESRGRVSSTPVDGTDRCAGSYSCSRCDNWDCQESCVWGHSDADGGRIWQSRKTPWTVCWRGVTRRLFSPRTGYSTS